jgi:spermidine/putrescine transport system ATP-binding protein
MSPDGAPPRPVILSLQGMTKDFGGLRAVDAVSLDIPEGEFLTIVGPSGSGKSTLVRLLAGLEAPSAGRLLLRGKDITTLPANRRPTAMVFQSLALFDWLQWRRVCHVCAWSGQCRFVYVRGHALQPHTHPGDR